VKRLESKRGVRCPRCGRGEYEESTIDFEYRGVIMPNTPCLKCNNCGDIIFTPDNYRTIWEKIRLLSPPLELKRKISRAGRRPALYLPEDIISSLNLKVGSEVRIYVQDRRRIVIEPATE